MTQLSSGEAYSVSRHSCNMANTPMPTTTEANWLHQSHSLCTMNKIHLIHLKMHSLCDFQIEYATKYMAVHAQHMYIRLCLWVAAKACCKCVCCKSELQTRAAKASCNSVLQMPLIMQNEMPAEEPLSKQAKVSVVAPS